MLYQSDILLTLAYLQGERSVNSTTSAPRAVFIQDTLTEAYKAYPWRFARTTATLSISSGIATLPTDFDVAHVAHVTWFDSDSNEYAFDEVDGSDKKDLVDGNSAVWIDAVGDGTRFAVNTKDTTPVNAVVRYQKLAPTLDTSDTVGTPYPNKMTLALGARRFVKLGQNPDADISQDQSLYEKMLAKDIAAEQVPSPRKRRRTAHSQTGRATGDF